MLNHVVEDEESKLEALRHIATKARRDDLIAQALHKATHKVFVRLK